MVETVYLWLKSTTSQPVALAGPCRFDPSKKSGWRKALSGAPWKTVRGLSLPRQFEIVAYQYSPKGQEEAFRSSVHEFLKVHVKGYE